MRSVPRQPFRRILPLLAAAILVSTGGALYAAELTIEVRTDRKISDVVAWAIPLRAPAPAGTLTAVMDQKNRMFIPHVLPVQTGTAVSFPNSDDVLHQVYSFSPARRFQLPLYKGTPGKQIVFDKPGIVSLGCNIHDQMSAFIVVVDTPWFGMIENGRLTLADLPAGEYEVHLWYPELRGKAPVAGVTLGDAQRSVVRFDVGRRK